MRTSHGIAVALSAGFRLATAAPVDAASTDLWVTTYPLAGGESGKVITFKLDSALQSVSESDACGAYPSWLTQAGDVLYCVNEAWDNAEEGELMSLQVGDDLGLTQLGKAKTIGGPVSTIIYGTDGRGLAVASYGAGGIDTFNIEDPAAPKVIKSNKYPALDNAEEQPQDIARPHHAVLDPTGDFLVFPDLGADMLRVLKVDKETLEYEEKPSYNFATRGTGPRHAAFHQAGDKTRLYVICELANLVKGFDVVYNEDQSLSFTEIFSANTHGGTDPLPEGTAAAEITVSPDSKFITLSSRLEKSLEYTLANGTTVPSDPLITFSIDAGSGELKHVQTAAAGGVNPRHFSFNKDGSRLASALQADGRVVVFERNVETGEIGKAVAETDIVGMPNFVIFKE